MLRTKAARKLLTKQEQKHLTESGINSMAAMNRQANLIREAIAKDDNLPAATTCWECRTIARKLGLLQEHESNATKWTKTNTIFYGKGKRDDVMAYPSEEGGWILYTREEWETQTAADWECTEHGSLEFQGKTMDEAFLLGRLPGWNKVVTVPCSLCGGPTEFEAGSYVAEWYLCDHCYGTPEAVAAGYTHEPLTIRGTQHNLECTLCGGEVFYMGRLGRTYHFRCRNCGADSHVLE